MSPARGRPWSLHTQCGPLVLGILAEADHAAARESCCIQSRHLVTVLFDKAISLTTILGLLPDQVQSIMDNLSVSPLESYHPPPGNLRDVYRLSNECKRAFAYSLVEASKRSPTVISAQDILIGLLTDEDVPTSAVLRENGLQIDCVRRALDYPLL